jgi:hypothetical protein
MWEQLEDLPSFKVIKFQVLEVPKTSAVESSKVSSSINYISCFASLTTICLSSPAPSSIIIDFEEQNEEISGEN